jgi:hypothetical protein
MIKRIKQTVNSILATTALVFALAGGAPAQDPGGRQVFAAAPAEAIPARGHQERTVLPMQTATLSPEIKLPPLDAAVPAHTETATFALG